MKCVSGILAAALTGLAALSPADAADMYGSPYAGYKDGPAFTSVNWSGLYAGLNGGYGWAGAGSGVDGAFGGGQIGYNIQQGSIVFGVETDFEGAGMSGGGSGSLDYFGTVRARVGYAFERALVYGTGGFGYDGCSDCSSGLGWVAGGGVEYKFTPSWSLKTEYQYMDTGKAAIDSFRAGVNYSFGGGSEPLK